MASDQTIAELEQRFPEGSFARGVVTHHVSFGFFVDLGAPGADGLVRIIDIKDEPVPISKADYPPIGSKVEAYVWGISGGDEARPQVILSVKPSLIHGAV
ncbi:S1 RNA-binding domain-containing protein [Rubrivirga sp.]|uniref:S1 RNA-binding domain-containing protein n=1 Tax=Rubrivirga sp. TaxID=1885344 RepID=UPI003C787E47